MCPTFRWMEESYKLISLGFPTQAPEEISAAACDDKPDRLDMAWLYNAMCKVLSENAHDSVEAHLGNKPAGHQLRKNLVPLEAIYQDINRILSPVQLNSPGSEQPMFGADQQPPVAKASFLATPQGDDQESGAEMATETKVATLQSEPQTQNINVAEPDLEMKKNNSQCDVPAADLCSVDAEPTSLSNGTGDVEMEEKQHNTDPTVNASTDESAEKVDPGVIVLDE
ncbi:unnamed protein product [Ilex paraguariensis]|uniref:Uncharacterized protein n=1 Tax=Ilex paraguariensis TaxID=185542 RepID=A0ABC8T2I2_9AQUA